MDQTTLDFQSYNKLKITEELVITILNEAGRKYSYKPVFYYKTTKISSMSASIYDANGKKIRDLKNSDLYNESAVSNGTMNSDDRVKFFNFTPTNHQSQWLTK